MNESVYDFEKGDELSDTKLIIEDKVLYVHKAILATASPVFKRMFTLDCKEKNENLVRLPNKRLDDIVELLKIIYPSYMKDIDETKVEILLELSEEYDMRKIQLTIEKYLLKKIQPNKVQKKIKLYGKSIENHLDYCLNLIYLANRYRLTTLKKDTIEYISVTFDKKTIISNLTYQTLIEDAHKIEILSRQIDYLEEKLKNKEIKFKQIEDDLLKQKFEIQRLNSLINN